MFGLISGFVSWYFSKTEVKVLVLGLDNAGKTTVLESLKLLFASDKAGSVPLDSILPTVGLNMGRLEAHGCDVTLWDLGGQQSFRSIWDKYYEDADVLIYVVDAADEERFDEARLTLQTLLEHPEASKLPVLVLANKSDLPLAHDANALNTLFDMKGIQTQRTGRLLMASAITSKGLDSVMEWVIETVKTLKEKAEETAGR